MAKRREQQMELPFRGQRKKFSPSTQAEVKEDLSRLIKKHGSFADIPDSERQKFLSRHRGSKLLEGLKNTSSATRSASISKLAGKLGLKPKPTPAKETAVRAAQAKRADRRQGKLASEFKEAGGRNLPDEKEVAAGRERAAKRSLRGRPALRPQPTQKKAKKKTRKKAPKSGTLKPTPEQMRAKGVGVSSKAPSKVSKGSNAAPRRSNNSLNLMATGGGARPTGNQPPGGRARPVDNRPPGGRARPMAPSRGSGGASAARAASNVARVGRMAGLARGVGALAGGPLGIALTALAALPLLAAENVGRSRTQAKQRRAASDELSAENIAAMSQLLSGENQRFADRLYNQQLEGGIDAVKTSRAVDRQRQMSPQLQALLAGEENRMAAMRGERALSAADVASMFGGN